MHLKIKLLHTPTHLNMYLIVKLYFAKEIDHRNPLKELGLNGDLRN